jgi:hypothetical protein
MDLASRWRLSSGYCQRAAAYQAQFKLREHIPLSYRCQQPHDNSPTEMKSPVFATHHMPIPARQDDNLTKKTIYAK